MSLDISLLVWSRHFCFFLLRKAERGRIFAMVVQGLVGHLSGNENHLRTREERE